MVACGLHDMMLALNAADLQYNKCCHHFEKMLTRLWAVLKVCSELKMQLVCFESVLS